MASTKKIKYGDAGRPEGSGKRLNSSPRSRSFLSVPVAAEVARARPACHHRQDALCRSYLLAALGGNSSPSAKDIKKILDSVGIEAYDDRLNKIISELRGKNIEDVIAQGIGKLASMPAGGAVAFSAAPGSALAAAEEKKEEKKEESEESDDDMGFGLFN
ncbi:PREDICTED: 60S acidic ribosomal protein P2-like [Elephantulus edwardii]|uniref:60S acidic ribosomal protein P2-like n=1 Tax=Elephantulus edwardii TaxID=28737 RepID=UPI0003F0C3B5|nr:PREDICTED: 60S acidic ribosomal protein P2-like [Elephantulus edwardii]